MMVVVVVAKWQQLRDRKLMHISKAAMTLPA
jgi:hypothetical protein